MHELGIVFHTIRTIEEVAAEQGLTRVGSVTLELGEVSGAIPLELVSCWDWAVNRTELLRRELSHCAARTHLPILRQRKDLAAAGE